MDLKPRKVFDVYIEESKRTVYNIEGKEHGGYNDTVKTWWIYLGEPLPDGVVPPIDSAQWHPFCVGINRMLWDIRVKQHNYTKEKWNSLRFSNTTSVEMWCNNKQVYGFTCGGGESGFAYAMAKVQYLQVRLSEHPYSFFEPEKEQGRKIFWKGLPATIQVKTRTWEIGVIPDYTEGLDKNGWWAELARREAKIGKYSSEDREMDEDDFNESKVSDFINWGDAFSDQYIDWFRK